MNIAQALLKDIEVFLLAYDITPTAFGIAAVNDGHLVRDLRLNAAILSTRIDKVRKFMDEYPGEARKVRPRRRSSQGMAA